MSFKSLILLVTEITAHHFWWQRRLPITAGGRVAHYCKWLFIISGS